ncbi:T9SS type A sorting domain-containing protein [Adhaeribacter radiodurans]|uniref:T9SS type A sorting domain-containing protein n=1 Tax=Adhaeribacter radiodurans TaxID=2745197 RepID=A0A7L7L6Q6_9BACT|nr:T9SS type A sorting domain-containing protein [Adhaeribacter radiodurans]QMU28205.1 T9SS type A sorting domain-containing protein [Adhaeribacter radiodurans]
MKKIILSVSVWLLAFNVFAQSQIYEYAAPIKLPGSNFYTHNVAPEIGVYPNPSTGKVFLSLAGFKGKRIQVRVTNVIGNLVLQESFNEMNDEATKVLNFSNFNKGLYYVKVDAEKYSEMRKVYII